MRSLATVLLAWAGLALCPLSLLAQSQTWQRRGAPPPAGARVEPENCRTNSDGGITCGTRIEGGTRRPPAYPSVNPFPN
ncbi:MULTISPECIES: hypothetical protein [Aphanothece]|uniref:hypothetical protein n=1 Tax=Aphanothece TaxID=1121 RepID=UPI00398E91A2